MQLEGVAVLKGVPDMSLESRVPPFALRQWLRYHWSRVPIAALQAIMIVALFGALPTMIIFYSYGVFR